MLNRSRPNRDRNARLRQWRAVVRCGGRRQRESRVRGEGKAGLLDGVLSMADEVVVPRPVAGEILAVDDDRDAAVAWMRTEKAQRALCDVEPPAPFVLAWDLGVGESAVLTAAAGSPGSVAVLDDLAARRCALALGISVTGTLGLLLMAKRAGAIVSLRRALDAVTDAGLFVSPKHVSAILAAGGE